MKRSIYRSETRRPGLLVLLVPLLLASCAGELAEAPLAPPPPVAMPVQAESAGAPPPPPQAITSPVLGSPRSAPPAAGPETAPPPAQWVYTYPQGQWVFTSDHGWIWIPAGVTTAEMDGTPYAYMYTPMYGWTWYLSPWGWGGYHYGGWVRYGWHPVGWHGGWVAHPHVSVRLGGHAGGRGRGRR